MFLTNNDTDSIEGHPSSLDKPKLLGFPVLHSKDLFPGSPSGLSLTTRYTLETKSSGFSRRRFNSICPICLETSSQSMNFLNLPCGHQLHGDCSESWFPRSSSCPICRLDVPKALEPASPTSEMGNVSPRRSDSWRSDRINESALAIVEPSSPLKPIRTVGTRRLLRERQIPTASDFFDALTAEDKPSTSDPSLEHMTEDDEPEDAPPSISSIQQGSPSFTSLPGFTDEAEEGPEGSPPELSDASFGAFFEDCEDDDEPDDAPPELPDSFSDSPSNTWNSSSSETSKLAEEESLGDLSPPFRPGTRRTQRQRAYIDYSFLFNSA